MNHSDALIASRLQKKASANYVPAFLLNKHPGSAFDKTGTNIPGTPIVTVQCQPLKIVTVMSLIFSS
jgi:hypothetical protein